MHGSELLKILRAGLDAPTPRWLRYGLVALSIPLTAAVIGFAQIAATEARPWLEQTIGWMTEKMASDQCVGKCARSEGPAVDDISPFSSIEFGNWVASEERHRKIERLEDELQPLRRRAAEEAEIERLRAELERLGGK